MSGALLSNKVFMTSRGVCRELVVAARGDFRGLDLLPLMLVTSSKDDVCFRF